MTSITTQLAQAFQKAIHDATGLDADPAVAPAANPQFGDYQCNAAMPLAKRLAEATGQKANPRDLASQIVAKLALGDMAADVSIAGPGFINVRLSPDWLAGLLNEAAADPRLGVPTAAQPQTVVVEYSSPNVAKEMHVGHIRSTILGDAAARLLAFLGHKVIRQNHIGDWGTQFGMLIALLKEEGTKARRHEGTKGEDLKIADLEDFYRRAKQRFDADPVFAEEARKTVVRFQAHEAEELGYWQKIVEESKRHFAPIYRRLNVQLGEPDVEKNANQDQPFERGESAYNDRLPTITDELQAAGVAEASEGAVVSFAGGFKAPLMVRKSDGGYGYGTTDLAAARFRAEELAAGRVIYFVDARQALHFKQVFATVEAAGQKAGWGVQNTRFEHASFGSILGEDGKPFKTRAGGTVKLSDLLDEAEQRALAVVKARNPDLSAEGAQDLARAVGIGGIKYFDLSKDRTSDYVFSFDAMLSLDGNTAPYLQYAHARIRSIFRRAELPDDFTPHVATLTEVHELQLAKHLLKFGDTLSAVANDLKPHVLCSYLYELATQFSGFYESCPVLKSEEPVRTTRLTLCALAGRTLATGLDLLGIEHPEQL
ncbi:MAG: arginine--tRNA ligase [Phycisphaerae bacterium]